MFPMRAKDEGIEFWQENEIGTVNKSVRFVSLKFMEKRQGCGEDNKDKGIVVCVGRALIWKWRGKTVTHGQELCLLNVNQFEI